MALSEPIDFKVITLNCWALRVPIVGAKLVQQRLEAIAERFLQEKPGVVVLEEVFRHADYTALATRLSGLLPYRHFFYSGLVGSGVCILSAHPIVGSTWHSFPVNGFPHKITHGDWYAGKGVGLCTLSVNGFTVNVYGTHMHARYNYHNDEEYGALRSVQAYSLAQFVRHTSPSCDLVVAAGDFNIEPSEAGYRAIKAVGELEDAWSEKHGDGAGDSTTIASATCCHPDNSFTTADERQVMPCGMRIDHIFYRANDHVAARLLSCEIGMGKIPGRDYNYSDHEAVIATIRLSRDITAGQCPRTSPVAMEESLREMGEVLDSSMRKSRKTQMWSASFTLFCVVVLLLARETYFDHGFHKVNEVLQVVFSCLSFIALWYTLVITSADRRACLSLRQDVGNTLTGIQRDLGARPSSYKAD